MDPAMGMGLVALMGAAATVAGCSEDLESDIGSQSNPNSQVQLAAQVGFRTEYLTKLFLVNHHPMRCTVP